jgi:hypothetical protein
VIIRIPIVRPAVGFHTFTLLHRKVKYYNRKILYLDTETGFQVVREESRGLVFSDVRYSLVSADEKILAFVRGYAKSRRNFYFERVEKTAGDKIGLAYVKMMEDAVHKDVKGSGFEYGTLLCPPRLAPIIMRRFGFFPVRGLSAEELSRGWRRRLPWKLVLLKRFC